MTVVVVDAVAQERIVARERRAHRRRCASHSRVLPSMSVNRNVTVPVGSGLAAAALCVGVMAPHYRRIRRRTRAAGPGAAQRLA